MTASAILAVLGSVWGSQALRRVHLLWLQAKCADHMDLPEVVAYETWPEAAKAATIAKPREYTLAAGAVRGVRHWEYLRQAIAPRSGAPRACIFLHRLRLTSQPERLVCLEAGAFPELTSTIVAPGTVARDPRVIAEAPPTLDSEASKLLEYGQSCRLGPRFYTGQADASDPSHFTFSIVLNGWTATMDGWLRPNDTVYVAAREPAEATLNRSADAARSRRARCRTRAELDEAVLQEDLDYLRPLLAPRD